MCPCNKRKPITAVFDSQSGYLGKIEYMTSIEWINPWNHINLKIYDHRDRHIMNIEFPRLNVISCFGIYPWQQYEKFDFKITRLTDNTPAVLVRKQWTHFKKELCSNGSDFFLKFKQRGMPWYHKQLVFESLMMLDMNHYNNRIVGGKETCFILSIISLISLVLIFFGIFAGITFAS